MGRVYRRLRVTAAGLCGERFIFSGVNSVNSDVGSLYVLRELQAGQWRCSVVLRNFRSKPNESIRPRTKAIPALDGCLRRLRYQRNSNRKTQRFRRKSQKKRERKRNEEKKRKSSVIGCRRVEYVIVIVAEWQVIYESFFR